LSFISLGSLPIFPQTWTNTSWKKISNEVILVFIRMDWAFSWILSLAKGGYGGLRGETSRRSAEVWRAGTWRAGRVDKPRSSFKSVRCCSAVEASVHLQQASWGRTRLPRPHLLSLTEAPTPPIEAATRQFRPLPGSLNYKSQPSRLVALAGLLFWNGPHLGLAFCFGCTYDSWSDPHTYTTHPHPSSHSQSHT